LLQTGVVVAVNAPYRFCYVLRRVVAGEIGCSEPFAYDPSQWYACENEAPGNRNGFHRSPFED